LQAHPVRLQGERMKRIAIATFFGLVAGGICSAISFGGGLLKFSAAMLVFVLLNRMVMGIVIGISGLKLHWAWNGAVLGVVVGSIFSWFLSMNGMAPQMAILTLIGNCVFGLMIEFFTTVVFKAPAAAAPRRAVAGAAVRA
jgi:hypothetical protein